VGDRGFEPRTSSVCTRTRPFLTCTNAWLKAADLQQLSAKLTPDHRKCFPSAAAPSAGSSDQPPADLSPAGLLPEVEAHGATHSPPFTEGKSLGREVIPTLLKFCGDSCWNAILNASR